MQNSLFPDSEDTDDRRSPKSRSASAQVQPAEPSSSIRELSARLPRQLRLGTSSWYFPGWAALVWDREYTQAQISKQGLRAYAQHPLLRTVSLDRAFYRPLVASEYAALASQVPDDFRFVVKAPAFIADAMLRAEAGHGLKANPFFLDPERAAREFVQPALEGLGPKAGALVFQLSPLPPYLISRMPVVFESLRSMLLSLPCLRPTAPDAVVAIEVRDPEFLTPAFTNVLREASATYCLGLHAKMPPIAEQLPILRALWPGPLVCRWNLHLRHGAYGYEDARRSYEPFDRMVDPDIETRHALARVIAGTVAAGFNAFVTIGNKAEGSAPLSVVALAQTILDRYNFAQPAEAE